MLGMLLNSVFFQYYLKEKEKKINIFTKLSLCKINIMTQELSPGVFPVILSHLYKNTLSSFLVAFYPIKQNLS